MPRKKIFGENYLHSHPRMEKQFDVPSDHVIIDRDDLEEVIRFFHKHPEYVEQLTYSGTPITSAT